MYSILFILITVGTLLFYVASPKVKTANDPAWLRRIAEKPTLAKLLGGILFVVSWVVVAYQQGGGSGTFAMVAYLMGSYSVVILLKPLRYFSAVRLAVVAGAALFLELIVF